MAFTYFQFPYFSDNYGVLLHCPRTNKTALIDAGDDKNVENALEETGWKLDEIWITHHHWDHTDGLHKLKNKTGATVIGPAYSTKNGQEISGLDKKLREGDIHNFASQPVHIIHTPGHTLDMINFHLPESAVIFTGDTLFAPGCGRLFEGTPALMWESLSKIMALAPETVIYSAHEYSLTNAAFALTIEPENKQLQKRVKTIQKQRQNGEATVPTLLADELATNPFLRAGIPTIKANLNMEKADDACVFAEIRRRKDNM